jgi:ABC-type phosphate transport system permease subunit
MIKPNGISNSLLSVSLLASAIAVYLAIWAVSFLHESFDRSVLGQMAELNMLGRHE